MGVVLDGALVAKAVHSFCKSPGAKHLFKKWTFGPQPDRGACFAIAQASQIILGQGDMVTVGYINADEDSVMWYRPTHIALKIDGWILDGMMYKPVDEALLTYRKKYYHKPFYKDRDVYIKPVCAEDFEEWVWMTHPYFVDQVEQGIREFL